MAESLAPIFIVGIPRSGTTLLATLLGSHSRISCGSETHFFPHLEANYSQVSTLLKDPGWPTKATAYVLSLNLENHKIADLFHLSPEEIYNYLARQTPSLRVLLESLTRQHMEDTKKVRWAEKTPNHILHLATIRRLYPHAVIVRIVRDPRDSAHSIAAQLPWASDSPLENAYLIYDWYQRSTDFFARDPLSYTLRYEDLVTQPVLTLQKLCEFIQEPFEPAMLSTEAAAEYTAPDHEPWKQQVSQTLNPSRCYAWRQRTIAPETRAISTLCQEMIEQFDYPPLEGSFDLIPSHYTTYEFIRSNSQAIRTLFQQGSLLTPRHPLLFQPGESVLYCDVPIRGKHHTKSLKKLHRFLTDLLALRYQGIPIQFSHFCVDPADPKNVWGTVATHALVWLGTPTELPV